MALKLKSKKSKNQNRIIEPVIIQVNVGPTSMQIQCPNCHQNVETKTTSEASKKAWLIGICLCLIGLVIQLVSAY